MARLTLQYRQSHNGVRRGNAAVAGAGKRLHPYQSYDTALYFF